VCDRRKLKVNVAKSKVMRCSRNAKLSELLKETKAKNEMRTEEKKFYWRVKDQRLRKWYMQGEEEAKPV